MKAQLFMALAVVSALGASAQNPIIRNQFTADPTARVFNGRLYMFPSHDIISPVEPEKKWFSMADYHMFSSTDLVEWTDHGVILSQEQVPWGDPKAYSMWAPDCVEHNGKYYFFFPDAPKAAEGERKGFGIGVAISDNLFWTKFVPQETNIQGVGGIDPCVLQASDGNAYMFWGGGSLFGAKLSDNLLELSDDNPTETLRRGDFEMTIKGVSVDKTLPKGFKEGPFAFEKDGKFYLTYPWVREENGTECLAYAMSDKPLGPYEYKGIIMAESPTKCWTNHHSIVNFKGQWYLFYHHNDYSPNFDKNRSVCVDSLSFNADGTINEVKPTLRGVGITDARKPIQIDRYSSIGGGARIEYLDTANYFRGWKTVFTAPGQFVSYNKVDTKSTIAQNVCLNVMAMQKSKFKLELGSWSAVITIPYNSSWQQVDITVPTMPSGINDLKITRLSGDKPVEIDWISLTEDPRPRYFDIQSDAWAYPDEEGFIRRWSLLEPIDKPNRSNTVFTDTYLREHLTREYFKGQHTCEPVDGDVVEAGNQTLKWHSLDSKNFNVKLFRFSTLFDKQEYGVLHNAFTVIDCPEEIKNVRLAVGSNGASLWWINGEETLLMSGDRRMVRDDCMSQRITLKKGTNIIRGVVINGPGMSDFCVRFVDEQGNPVRNFRIERRRVVVR